jgi:hypothetical protein
MKKADPRATRKKVGKSAPLLRGIAPLRLLEQVKSTAPWAFSLTPPLPSAAPLLSAAAVETHWAAGREFERYFAFLLAAHFTTVATFVPTDVDQAIRVHAWNKFSGASLASAIAHSEAVASWDVRPITARHIVLQGEVLAGHQGEWFSVIAGALGRALALGDTESEERATAWIDTELAREAKLVKHARKDADDATLLAVITTVAHNLGDLSRVVETWSEPWKSSEKAQSYLRLGHGNDARFKGAFAYVGELNTSLMAKENHRFLPLRLPRALRREQAFLLPFGPYFYDWGSMLGTTPKLSDEERAEILAALLDVHARRNEEHGCLRAIAGMNDSLRGGIDSLAQLLPVAVRPRLHLGGVRSALRQKESAFLAAFHRNITR